MEKELTPPSVASSALPAVQWWEQARQELTQLDPKLGLLIFKLSDEALCPSGRPFEDLIKAVIAQQISTEAAERIWDAFIEACPQPTPSSVLRKHRRTLRLIGLSDRKIESVYDICKIFLKEDLSLEAFEELADDAIIKMICRVNGIGRWSADMFLIFSLGRPDVLPIADPGLKRGLINLYFKDTGFENLSASKKQEEIRSVTDKWRPWRTLGTWYLWKSLSEEPEVEVEA